MAKRDDNLIPTPDVLKRQMGLRKPPFWLVAGLVTLVAVSFLPIAWIARWRSIKHSEPRVILWRDMGQQPKQKAQSASAVFADGRAAREPVAGTVVYGSVVDDPHYTLGYESHGGGDQVSYFAGMPPQIKVDQKLLDRGQERFMIYCFPCHGADGQGNGPVSQRAVEIQESGETVSWGTAWVPASNIVAVQDDGQLQYGSALYPDGKLFTIITQGVRNMPAYGEKIEVNDRWAIVAYIRALQLAQYADVDRVPAEKRDALKN